MSPTMSELHKSQSSAKRKRRKSKLEKTQSRQSQDTGRSMFNSNRLLNKKLHENHTSINGARKLGQRISISNLGMNDSINAKRKPVESFHSMVLSEDTEDYDETERASCYTRMREYMSNSSLFIFHRDSKIRHLCLLLVQQ